MKPITLLAALAGAGMTAATPVRPGAHANGTVPAVASTAADHPDATEEDVVAAQEAHADVVNWLVGSGDAFAPHLAKPLDKTFKDRKKGHGGRNGAMYRSSWFKKWFKKTWVKLNRLDYWLRNCRTGVHCRPGNPKHKEGVQPGRE